MPQVVNTINHHQEKTFKSLNQLLVSFFTAPQDIVPQSSPRFYKYNINEKVGIVMTPGQRKQLGFKYTLNRGKGTPSPPLLLPSKCE